MRGANANSLAVAFDENKDYQESLVQFGNFKIGGDDKVIVDDVNLDIEPSDDAKFHLVQKNTAWARTYEAAGRAAGAVEYNLVQTDSALRFAPYLYLPKGTHWNNQKIRLTLKVPIGKTIKIDETAGRYVLNAKVYQGDKEKNEEYDQSFYDTHTYRMTNAGLDCLDCINKSNASDNSDNEDETYNGDEENSDKKRDFKIKGDFEINEKGIRIKGNKDSISIKM